MGVWRYGAESCCSSLRSGGDLRGLVPRGVAWILLTCGPAKDGPVRAGLGWRLVETCCGYYAATSGLCCLPRQRPGEEKLKSSSQGLLSGCLVCPGPLPPALTWGSSCVCVYRTVSITCSHLSLIHLHVKSVVLKVGFWTTGISITRELIRNANYPAPPQTYRI